MRGKMNRKNFYRLLVIGLIGLIITLFNCAEEEPLSPQTIRGKIIGVVKPFGIKAQVDLKQGSILQTVYADSVTGIYEFSSVASGVYNLEFSANRFGRQVLNEVMILEGRVTTIRDIILRPLPEQIYFINPADGASGIAVNAAIEIQFTTLMDRATVENQFSIYPPTDGYFEWETNSSGNKLLFHPGDQYITNHSYTIALGNQAKTINGDTLAFDITSAFSTESLKLVSSIPENGATYISPEVIIYLSFNSKVDRRMAEDSIKFSPPLFGDFKWLDSRRLSFDPGAYLASNTQYTVENLDKLIDIYGSVLTGKNALSFETEPLRVIANFPANGATRISRNTSIVIGFNTAVNQASVERAFRMTPQPGNWYFQWTDLTRFQYMGSTQLQANTMYQITIQDSVCTDNWGNPLPAEFSIFFSTGN